MNKMIETLSPYFTDNFLQVFTDENSRSDKQSGEYLLPAKEAPFSFNSETKMSYDEEHKIYMYMSGQKWTISNCNIEKGSR